MTHAEPLKADWNFEPTMAQKLVIEFNRKFGLGNGAARLYGTRLLENMRAGPIAYDYFGLHLRFFPPLKPMAHMLLSPNWSETKERAFLNEMLPRAGAFLDVGANVGYYTFFVAAVRPAMQIISVEPIASNACMLRFNAERNGLSRIEVEEIALSDSEGSFPFCPKTQSMVVGEGTERVRTTTLAQLMKVKGLTAIDGMKIDIEGAEDRALMPFFMEAQRSAWPRVVLIEHACQQHWMKDCLGFMMANGYRVCMRSKLNSGLVLDRNSS